jgi:hypothetical protein
MRNRFPLPGRVFPVNIALGLELAEIGAGMRQILRNYL